MVNAGFFISEAGSSDCSVDSVWTPNFEVLMALFACQMPKVSKSPIINPTKTARKTSFCIAAYDNQKFSSCQEKETNDKINKMEITYLGHSSFRIKGKDVYLVTDPFAHPDLGFKFPKVEADIVTVSHDHRDHNAVNEIGGNPFIISGPGEYEVKGVSVFGISSFHDAKLGKERGPNTIYVIEMDGLRICHLGDLGEALSDKQLEEINGVDVLMVPIGGIWTLNPEQTLSIVSAIEPSIVLPMHFKVPGMAGEMTKLAALQDFLKLTDQANVVPVPKLVVSKDKLPEEKQFVILERKV